MRRFWVLVRLKNEPGAAFVRQYITADNPITAICMARAIYGNLLISEGATAE